MSDGHAMGNADGCAATDGAAPAMPRFAQNPVGRDFAVGDIHGCFTELQRGLDAIGFDPSTDRLFSVGDLVDRGPESHLALRWLDKPWFHGICGNHDFMAWRHAIGQPCDDVDHLQHGGAWLLVLSGAQRHEFGARLAALPLALEVETGQGVVGLVHADCPYDDWSEMRRVPWHDTKAVSAAADCCLWSFERYSRCRFPFKLSLLIFQLALVTLSMWHRARECPRRILIASLSGGDSTETFAHRTLV